MPILTKPTQSNQPTNADLHMVSTECFARIALPKSDLLDTMEKHQREKLRKTLLLTYRKMSKKNS